SARNAADLQRARAGGRDAAAATAERHELYRLEVDERLVVVGDRLDLRGTGQRQVALRLEHEEGLAHARGHFFLLGFQLLLLELARGARRRDALLVGLHV